MKKWILFPVMLVLALACSNDDDFEIYDPELQWELDKATIADFLSAEGIAAAEDSLTGIRYVILQEGPEEIYPEVGDSLTVDYELYNFQGELLDTSIEDVAREGGILNVDRVYAPLVFRLGTRQLITGFQRGAQLLNEGGKGDFYIPSVYAYQNQGSGSGNIAPNESIHFRLTLVRLKK